MGLNGNFVNASVITSAAFTNRMDDRNRFQFDAGNATDSDFFNLKIFINGMRINDEQKTQLQGQGAYSHCLLIAQSMSFW